MDVRKQSQLQHVSPKTTRREAPAADDAVPPECLWPQVTWEPEAHFGGGGCGKLASPNAEQPGATAAFREVALPWAILQNSIELLVRMQPSVRFVFQNWDVELTRVGKGNVAMRLPPGKTLSKDALARLKQEFAFRGLKLEVKQTST